MRASACRQRMRAFALKLEWIPIFNTSPAPPIEASTSSTIRWGVPTQRLPSATALGRAGTWSSDSPLVTEALPLAPTPLTATPPSGGCACPDKPLLSLLSEIWLPLLARIAGDIPKLPLNLALLKGCSIVGVFWGQFSMLEAKQNAHNLSILAKW